MSSLIAIITYEFFCIGKESWIIFLSEEVLNHTKFNIFLILTFFMFFIFAGNMARIDAVNNLLSGILNKNTLLTSVLSCQFISNVPSAILLSQFTENYADLLVGVNIGGTGTLIASLASLITFREYSKQDPGHTLRYIIKFSLFNFGFLAILTAVMMIVK